MTDLELGLKSASPAENRRRSG